MLYGAKKVVKDFICLKERIHSPHEIELKRCLDKTFFSQIILHQEKYDKQSEKLHYLPNHLNQTILVLPWTYSRLKSMLLQTQGTNSQMISAT